MCVPDKARDLWEPLPSLEMHLALPQILESQAALPSVLVISTGLITERVIFPFCLPLLPFFTAQVPWTFCHVSFPLEDNHTLTRRPLESLFKNTKGEKQRLVGLGI